MLDGATAGAGFTNNSEPSISPDSKDARCRMTASGGSPLAFTAVTPLNRTLGSNSRSMLPSMSR